MDSGHFQDMMDHIDEKVNLGAFPIDGPPLSPNDPYGWYYNGWFGQPRPTGLHGGIDFPAQDYAGAIYGPDLVAMYGGKVVEIKLNEDANGYYIVIEAVVDGKTIRYSYSHMHELPTHKGKELEVGDSIDAGDTVGVMGTTGKRKDGSPSSSGSHLHLGITELDPSTGEFITVNPDPNYKGPGRSGYDPAYGTGYIPVPYGW